MAVQSFLFVTCQVGAEGAVKGEIARRWPEFRFSFSRPGFLTFKLPADHGLAEDFDLESVFARAYGFSLGAAEGESDAARAEAAARAFRDHACAALHVWPRDIAAPGHRGYRPGQNDASRAADAAIRAALGDTLAAGPARVTRPGEKVLDCILLGPEQWWLGVHRARSLPSCWPGGLCPLGPPEDAVSRAYVKLEEGLLWSGLPLKAGERCAEIGCSPGGAAQALLRRGLIVTGIDPADVDPRVAGHPNFTHVRKRGADVRRREFRKTRWLLADINVAPQYALDTVEAIVTHPEVDVRGLLLTLKLLDWELAAQVPAYLDRIRSWGYGDVRARQLHHNRQEICVAARRKGRESRAEGRGREVARPSS